MSKAYIVIVNWNGWEDTIECLESVFCSNYSDYQVIVCDNASQDGSLEHIKAWAEGRQNISVPNDNPLSELTSPPVPKPIPYIEYATTQAESGGNLEKADARLVLIHADENKGYAAGNNVAMRYALARDDFDYIWLLNNDTVVKPDSLSRMIERITEVPGAGMCGATLLYYHDPSKVQSLCGVVYNKWFGTSKQIGHLQPENQPFDVKDVERRITYIAGACMLVTRQFVQTVGLMSEDYFLYCEELDWTARAKKRFKLAYAPNSIVYHKEGKSIGANNYTLADKSLDSDYYYIRNKLIVTRRHFPYALPTVYLGMLVTLFNRIRRKQWDRVGMILKLWWSA